MEYKKSKGSYSFGVEIPLLSPVTRTRVKLTSLQISTDGVRHGVTHHR